MTPGKPTNTAVRVLIILILTLTFFTPTEAQTNKPKQLRKEVLQSKAKEDKKEAVTPRKNLLGGSVKPGTTAETCQPGSFQP